MGRPFVLLVDLAIPLVDPEMRVSDLLLEELLAFAAGISPMTGVAQQKECATVQYSGSPWNDLQADRRD